MRFIVAGLGFWGQTWAKLLEAHPQVKIVGAVDPSPAAGDWANRHLGMTCHMDLSDALRLVEADAVLIANPVSHHTSAVLAALSSGKHALVEKPLATTWEDALEVREAVKRSSSSLMVAQGYRFVDGAKCVRERVQSGQLGDLRHVRITFRKYLPDFLPVQHSIYSWQHSLVIDMGVHHFDLLRFITGKEVTRVYASEHETPDNAFVYPSNAVGMMKLQGDAAAIWDADWCSFQPPTPWEGHWEFVGTKGRLFWRSEGAAPHEPSIWIQLPGASPERLPFHESVTDRREPLLEHFLDAVAYGRQPEPGVDDNLKTLDVALSCAESIRSNAEVSLRNAGRDTL